jgi:uncharacterized iron-regulated protein
MLIQVIRENITAIFVLLGTIIGAVLTFVGTLIHQNREMRNRFLEKLIEKRMEAHEQIISLTKMLRSMKSLGYSEENGELARSPICLNSKEDFNEAFARFYQVGINSSTWLSTVVTREFNFIQDYLINLSEFLKDVDSQKYPKIGQIIRQDFIDFSSTLEKYAFNYFQKELL